MAARFFVSVKERRIIVENIGSEVLLKALGDEIRNTIRIHEGLR